MMILISGASFGLDYGDAFLLLHVGKFQAMLIFSFLFHLKRNFLMNINVFFFYGSPPFTIGHEDITGTKS